MADFIPDSQFVPDPQPQAMAPKAAGSPDFIPDQQFQSDEDKYGTTGQQIGAGLEGVAQGVLGPLAPAAERFVGIKPEDIRGRAEANPTTHSLGEVAGFTGSMLSGIGEAGIVGGLGEAAAKATGLGLEGASTISKIASGGIKTGAEMAALQSGDEISKMITEDPSQSLGTAAINVGLSGIMGGAGGAVLGAVSPLFKSSIESMGIPKILDDAKAQYQFRQGLPNGDVGAAIENELNTRLNEVHNMNSQFSDIRGEAISKALPEVSRESTEKIDAQINEVVHGLDSKIKSIIKSNDPYLKSSIPKLEFHKNQLLSATEEGFSRGKPIELSPGIPKVSQEQISVTPVRFDENPNKSMFPWLRDEDVPPKLVRGEEQPIQAKILNANPQKPVRYTPVEFRSKPYVDKFNALDSLKRDFQGLVNYERNSAEDTAMGGIARDFAAKIRQNLEDHKVWGEAANIQREANAAITDFKQATKEIGKKFTNTLEGQTIADPGKVSTLIKQSLRGSAGIKEDLLENYIKKSERLADKLNSIHVDAGLDAPIRMTPTPALDHTLGRSSPGTSLGNWLFDKGASTVAGHIGADVLGAGLGSMVGHPVAGALIGEKMLAPVFTSLAKPILESASRSDALRGSIEYVASVIKGERLLNKATQSLFKSGSEILPQGLLPNMASRDKLEKSIEHNSVPDHALNVAGNLGHYLPNHASTAAATAAAASNYLNGLRPKETKLNPLDRPAPIDKAQQARYHRALDIAQQPLVVLQHVKAGTLQPQDVQTLQTIYPGLHRQMVQKISDQMIKSVSEGHQIPYKQRVSMSLLIGHPLDTTMTQSTALTVMQSNALKGGVSPQSGHSGNGRVTKSTPTSMAKVDSLYATPNQSRAMHRAR